MCSRVTCHPTFSRRSPFLSPRRTSACLRVCVSARLHTISPSTHLVTNSNFFRISHFSFSSSWTKAAFASESCWRVFYSALPSVAIKNYRSLRRSISPEWYRFIRIGNCADHEKQCETCERFREDDFVPLNFYYWHLIQPCFPSKSVSSFKFQLLGSGRWIGNGSRGSSVFLFCTMKSFCRRTTGGLVTIGRRSKHWYVVLTFQQGNEIFRGIRPISWKWRGRWQTSWSR